MTCLYTNFLCYVVPLFFCILVFQDLSLASEFSQRFCTIEAQFSLLLRISHHYGKHGSQILLSMGALQNLSSFNLMGFHKKVLFCDNITICPLWICVYSSVFSGKFKNGLHYCKRTGWWNWEEEVTYSTRIANSHLFYFTCGLGWFPWG